MKGTDSWHRNKMKISLSFFLYLCVCLFASFKPQISYYEPNFKLLWKGNQTQGQSNVAIGRSEHKLHNMYCT